MILWFGIVGCHLLCLGLSGKFTEATEIEKARGPALPWPVFSSLISTSLLPSELFLESRLSPLLYPLSSPMLWSLPKVLMKFLSFTSDLLVARSRKKPIIILFDFLFLISLFSLGLHNPFLAFFGSPLTSMATPLRTFQSRYYCHSPGLHPSHCQTDRYDEVTSQLMAWMTTWGRWSPNLDVQLRPSLHTRGKLSAL